MSETSNLGPLAMPQMPLRLQRARRTPAQLTTTLHQETAHSTRCFHRGRNACVDVNAADGLLQLRPTREILCEIASSHGHSRSRIGVLSKDTHSADSVDQHTPEDPSNDCHGSWTLQKAIDISSVAFADGLRVVTTEPGSAPNPRPRSAAEAKHPTWLARFFREPEQSYSLTRTGKASWSASHSTEEHPANRQGNTVLWCTKPGPTRRLNYPE